MAASEKKSVDNSAEKLEPSCVFSKNVNGEDIGKNGAAAVGNNMVLPPKVKPRITTLTSNSTARYLLQRINSMVSKRYLYTHVYISIIHNN